MVDFNTGHAATEAALNALLAQIKAPPVQPIVVDATNYVVTANIQDILVGTTSGSVTVTLPDATASGGQRFSVKKISSDANPITVASAVGGQTIDGAATLVFATAQRAYSLLSDGANYQIIAKHDGVAN